MEKEDYTNVENTARVRKCPVGCGDNYDILRTHLERPGPSDDNDDILKNHLERRLKADSPSAL